MESAPPNTLSSSSHNLPSHSGNFIPSYFRQTLAHLYFLIATLFLSVRWQMFKIFGLKFYKPQREKELLTRMSHRYIALLEHLGIIKAEFIGFENAASWKGSVLAPNHPSLLDAILIISRVTATDCVINSKLLSDPMTSGVANLGNFVRNDGLLHMIKTCQQRLLSGSNMLIFPEGTRTATPPLGKFHHAYVLAAIRSGAPIQTVLIECDSDYFGHSFSFLRPARCTAQVTFKLTAGKIFCPDRDADPRMLSAEIESYFRSQLSLQNDLPFLRSA